MTIEQLKAVICRCRTTLAVLAAIALCAAAAACSASSNGTSAVKTFAPPTSASSAVAKAETPATQADAYITAQHYTVATKVPGFGKYAVGYNTTLQYKYVIVVQAKTAQDATYAVTEINKDPQTGVTVKAVGNLVVLQATNLSAANNARKAYEKFIKDQLKSKV